MKPTFVKINLPGEKLFINSADIKSILIATKPDGRRTATITTTAARVEVPCSDHMATRIRGELSQRYNTQHIGRDGFGAISRATHSRRREPATITVAFDGSRTLYAFPRGLTGIAIKPGQSIMVVTHGGQEFVIETASWANFIQASGTFSVNGADLS